MNTKVGKLIIVDDEPGLVRILTQLLENHASEVHTAADGQEAFQAIRTGTFDAVLSDINMPQESGLELLARVRHANLDTPFVFLTGYADKEKTLEALRLGATDFLEKPFDPAIMIGTMRKALELGHTMRIVEAEMESFFRSGEIPPDRRLKLRKTKQALTMMRYSMNIYKKPA